MTDICLAQKALEYDQRLFAEPVSFHDLNAASHPTRLHCRKRKCSGSFEDRLLRKIDVPNEIARAVDTAFLKNQAAQIRWDKTMKAVSILFGATVLMASAATGVQAATEQPKYNVIDQVQSDIEIRRYLPRTVAEVVIPKTDGQSARRQAFRILAGYIFGKNRAKSKIAMTAPVETQGPGEKIAMTAPVQTQAAGGMFRMAFFLPARYSAKTAPAPLDSRIRIRTVPAVVIAAFRFSGAPDEADMKRRWAVLQSKLSGTKWQVVGKPVSYFYNPPWTLPFLRRNEVAVKVKAR